MNREAGRSICGQRAYQPWVDSTNLWAGREAESGAPHGAVFAADCQTAGRGRRGRSWESPAGKNLYFTLLLRPELVPDQASMLTLVMALAVQRGIQDAVAQAVESLSACAIKWPNDIVMNGKKVCGILTEMRLEQGHISHVLIGVGINVKRQEFAPELVDKATDLETECGKSISRELLLEEILRAFWEEYEEFLKNGNLAGQQQRYNAALINLDRQVLVLDPAGEFEGIARGINEWGELLVELPDGTVEEIRSGEVSVRGLYGYV